MHHMFKGMTGYGRAQVASPICDIFLELISVNRKHLDIRFTLPMEMGRFEPFLRSLFEGKVERGTVQLKLQVKWKEELPLDLYPNTPLIKKYAEIRRSVEEELDIPSNSNGLIEWIFEQPGTLITLENEKNDREICALLKEAFDKAMIPFS